jgi:hypothetical protein
MKLSDTTKKIFALIPEGIIPNAEDKAIISKYRVLLASYEDSMVTGFLNMAYENNKLTIHNRALREHTLRQWYRLTIARNFDEYYWDYQVLTGIEQVNDDMSNAVMLSMRGWIMNFFQKNLVLDLDITEAIKVLTTLQKLQSIGSILTIVSSILTKKEAIRLALGLNDTILSQLVDMQINTLLQDGQTQLSTSTKQLEKVT